MAEEKEFQMRLQKVGTLVQELENIADPASRAAAKALVRVLMELHGTGLERMLELVFESGETGGQIIDELGRDPLVSSLLILHGLHPEELATRVERKMKDIDSKLHKMGAEAKLVSIQGGDVRVRVRVDSHACGSTGRTVKGTVEEAIYEAAPDLTSLVIEGLEEPEAGFIAVETLLGRVQPIGAAVPAVRVSLGSEGMD